MEEETVWLLGFSDPLWLALAPVFSRLDFELSGDGGFTPQACGGAVGVTWRQCSGARFPALRGVWRGCAAVRCRTVGFDDSARVVVAAFTAVCILARSAYVFGFFAASFAR